MTTDTVQTLDFTEQITIHDRDHGTRTVPGLIVAPGLAIHQGFTYDRTPVPRRYRITHTPSGRWIHTGHHCATHIHDAVTGLVATGIDWTQDVETLLAAKDVLVSAIHAQQNLCRDRRYGCPGDPKPWQIRCNTCDWEFDPEEDGDDVTTATAAKRIADDHECERWLEIQAPGTGRWRSPGSFNDDGAVRS